MKKVLIIQHSTSVLPAFAATFLAEQNIPFEILSTFDDKNPIELPNNTTSEYSAIISLGGSQGAYECELYPYLKWEKSFLAKQLELNTPILGICLDAQLIADIISGHSYKSTRGFEVGYVDYELTSEGKIDPILSVLFEIQQNKPLLIMHHGDTFDLPINVPILARTSNGYTAPYRFGSTFCVQFHPKTTIDEFRESVHRIRKNRSELYEHVNIEEILSYAEKSRRLFFQTWWCCLILKRSSIDNFGSE